ncbi:hypothetical protein [Lacinutrix cladophorae]
MLTILIFIGCSVDENSNSEEVKTNANKSLNLENDDFGASNRNKANTLYTIRVEYKPGTTQAEKQVIINSYAGDLDTQFIESCPNNQNVEIWWTANDPNCQFCADPLTAQIEEEPEVNRVIQTSNCPI